MMQSHNKKYEECQKSEGENVEERNFTASLQTADP
jgi:hypothetical protein